MGESGPALTMEANSDNGKDQAQQQNKTRKEQGNTLIRRESTCSPKEANLFLLMKHSVEHFRARASRLKQRSFQLIAWFNGIERSLRKEPCGSILFS